MTLFWRDAQSLFETACRGSACGQPECDLAILIDPRGQLHMRDAAGWSLAGLAAEYGAHTTYHLTRQHGRVRLEGRCGAQSFLIRHDPPPLLNSELAGSALPSGYPALLPPQAAGQSADDRRPSWISFA